MDNERVQDLFDGAMSGRLSRRQVLRRAMALGLGAPAVAALLAACGGGSNNATTAATTASNAVGTTASKVTGGSPTATHAATPSTGAASPVATPRATPAGSPSASPIAITVDKNTPPTVANAAAAKQYSSQKITYYGDSVGQGHDIDMQLAGQFTKDTGIAVNVVARPSDSTESFAQYQRIFQGKSADMDVGMFDVIWPGAVAQHLVDLSQALGNEAKLHYQTIIQNNTINGKLVAMPWFGDFGMLYYRTDLLQKYGFNGPPQTWDDLESMAKKVMDGEKAANANFQGFVFQGAAYEGLTCDALEWLVSSGGGSIIDQSGKVTVNNPQATAMLNRTKGWVGTITPKGVTTFKEDDARMVFQGGNSAFMRNWPYAYATAEASDSPIKGKFDVAPLPAQSGQQHVGTVGGWQLGVSNYSNNKQAAIEFVRYMTSPEVQAWRAVVGSYVPTIQAVADNPQVAQVMPFLQTMANVVRVTRPSSQTGEQYNQVSTAFFQGVNQILNGQDAGSIVPNMAQQIQRAMGG